MDNQLGSLFDALPGLVWTALPGGHIDFLNQTWCDYTGLSPDEARGDGWQVAVHPEDLPDLCRRWQAVLASGKPSEMEARLRRFDGEYRLFLFRTRPLDDASGQPVRWSGIGTDIEDRTHSQEMLQSRWWLWPAAREQHFRSIINDLPALAVHVTPAGRIVHVNRQVLEYFGAALQEMTGWRIADIVHPEDVQIAIDAWREGVETGRSYDVEVRLRRADGVYRWFRGRGIPLRDMDERIVLWYFLLPDARADGSDFEHEHRLLMPDHSVKHLHVVAHGTRDRDGRVEYIGAVQDVTQRRLAEEALGKARSELAHVARVTALGALTASIAHEVNQPLSGIITNANTCLRMLAADPPNVEGAQETARRTIRDGNRASKVIARLRALFTNKTFATEPVDLNEAAREVIASS
jgi:PAS domain S-box-containing protein